jgi:hypothetical protein
MKTENVEIRIANDLCKILVGRNITSSFTTKDFYKCFKRNEVRSSWNGNQKNSFVDGIKVDKLSFKYPFMLHDFLRTIKEYEYIETENDEEVGIITTVIVKDDLSLSKHSLLQDIPF